MSIYFDKDNQLMRLADLKLGDTVQVYDGPYGTGIVCEITGDAVWFYRPYGTNADFSCSGKHGGSSVICYTGLETFSRPLYSSETIRVYRREDNIR